MKRMFALALVPALLLLSAVPLVDAEEEAESPAADPVHHALVQKKVGFYAVYLPPDYHDEANAERDWPVCVILHGHGSSETGHGSLSESFGRDGVIYVAPRAAHIHKELLEEGRRGYTAWPTYPDSWGEWDSEDFPREEAEKLQVDRLYTDWIADCLSDARVRYRVDDRRAVVVGHSQGAMFAHTFALHRPELVRAYYAYAGSYDGSLEDDVAALTHKKHDIHAVLTHCEDDPVVGVEGTRNLAEYFKEHEVSHEVLIQPGGHHGFTSKIMRAAQEFVAKWCRGEELPPLKGELVVTGVVEDSQAEEIGLKEGDVITSYNGKAVTNMDDLLAAMNAADEGADGITIKWRSGETEKSAEVNAGRLGVNLADR